MSSRRVWVLASLFAFGCAAQQSPQATPSPSTPSEKPNATAPAATEKPLDPAAQREADKKKIEETRVALEASRTAVRESIAAIAEKNAGAPIFDRAREELAKLEKLLADSQPLEAKDEEYARESAVVKLELEKAKADFDAKWLEVGVGLHKPVLDEALKQVVAASRATAQKAATEEDLTKASAAIDLLAAAIERGVVLESKDPKYAQFAAAKKTQLEAQKKALDANRKRIAVLAQQNKVASAKTAVDQVLVQLRKSTDELLFEATQAALNALEEALAAGKEIEAGDANYLKFANNIRATVEKSKAEIVLRRTAQKVALQKTAVETARAAAKAAIAPVAPAVPNVEEAEKAVAELEKALEAGKELATTDKAYGQYAAVVAKEAANYKAGIDRVRQQAEIAADRTKVQAAAADLDTKVAALAEKSDAETLAAAEQAAVALEAALKAAEPLGVKDKAYAAELAAIAKKAAGQKSALGGKNNDLKIAAHRAELEAAKAAMTASLEALKGKLEQELYLKAEDDVAAYAKVIEGGEPLGALNAKYAQELTALKNVLPGRRLEMRLTRIEAAKAAVAEKLKVLEGDADDAAYGAAEESVRTLANTVEAAKTFPSTDKNYLASVAASEKLVPVQTAAIAKLRTGQKVRKHRAAIDAALASVTEKMKALDGEPESAAFGAAESAVGELKSALESGEAGSADGDKTHLAYVAGLAKRVEASKAQIALRRAQVAVAAHRKERAAADAAVKEKIAALAAPPASEGDVFAPAEDAVSALEKVIDGGSAAGELDAKYAKELVAAKAGIAGYRAQIEKRRTEVAATAAKTKIDEAAAAVAKELNDDTLGALEEALSGAEGAAAKDAKLLALVNALKNKLPAQRVVVTKKKTDEKVAAHRAEVAAQNKKIEENIAALKGKLDQALYQGAEESLTALAGILENGEPIGSEDAKYAAELKAQLAAIPARRAQLRRFRVEAASAAVLAQIKTLDGAEVKPEAFEEASDAVDVLTKIVEAAKSFSSPDKNYLAFVAASEKQIPGYTAAIEKKRTGLLIAAHKTKVEAAAAALLEQLKKLAGEPPAEAFEAAAGGATDFEKSLEFDASKVADKGYQTYLAAQKNKLGGYRAQIEKRRAEVALITQKKKIEAADAAIKEMVAALGSDASLEAAEGAVKNLEKMLSDEAASKDKKHLQFVAAMRGRLPAYQNAIDKQRAAKAIAAHQAELAAAETAANAAISALAGKTEQELYIAAEDAVANLKKVVEAGSELGEKDAAYGKRLAQLSATLPARRLAMRKQRVEASNVIALERVKEAEAKPDEPAFTAAEKALRDLTNTIESAGGGIGKEDPQFVKYLDGQNKAVAAYQARLEKRKVQIAVDEHKAELEEAIKDVDFALGALKGKPEGQAFDDAEKAVSKLETAVNSGSDAAAKNAEYGKRLAVLGGKLDGYRKLIEQRRAEVEVTKHREQVSGAVVVVSEKLNVLSQKPEEAAFAAAEEAISSLESVVKDGNSVADKNKVYTKELALQQQKIAGYKARVAKSRADLERKQQEEELDSAEAEVAEKLKSIEAKPEAGAFDEAEASIAELEKAIAETTKLGGQDKALARKLVELKKGLGKRRAAIAAGRVELEFGAHREAVGVAEKEVEKRIGALAEEASEGKIRAAVGSVKELETAIQNGDPLAKKSKKHAQWVASARKKAGEYRAAILQRAVEDEIKSHREDVERAQSELADTIKGLEGQLEYSLYSAAEDAISKVRKIIERGATLVEKSPAYEKEMAAASAQVDSQRVLIRRKWIEAADAAATEKMKALQGKPQESAFADATAAVRVLANTAESGKPLAANNKQFAAFVAASEKKAAKFNAMIEKRRSELEFAEVRGELDEAVKAVNEKVAAAGAGGEGQADAFGAAIDAIEGLERSIEANAPAAEKDKAYGKRLAILKKKVAADRAKIEKLKAVAELAPFKAKLAAAEKGLGQRVLALKGEPNPDAFGAVEDAIVELEGVIEEGKALDSQKAAVAKARKKIDGARVAMNSKRGALEAAQHREKVEAALAAAKESLGGEDDAAAKSAIKDLMSVIEDGKSVAKKDKKHAKYLAAVRKTGGGYLAAIKKKAADAARAEREAELAQAKAEKAREAAEAREAAAEAKKAREEKIAAAKAAKAEKAAEAKAAKLAKAKEAREAARLAKEEKAARIAEAKAEKARAKKEKIEAARLAKEEKAARIAEAKAEKARLKAEKLAAARDAATNGNGSGDSDSESEEDEPAAKPVNPTAKLAAALATAKKRMKALGPRPNEEKLASAREAVEELASVVDETKGDAKKFKGYGKKLAKARAALGKQKKELSKREAAFAKASAKAARATTVAETDVEEDGESGENGTNGNGHSAAKVDHQKKLKSAWAAFSKQVKALKGKKPTLEDFDAALDAASEVEAALKEGDQAGALKNPKYKKLATSIKKKLQKERVKIKKKREQSEYT